MTIQNDFLTFSAASGANVLSQASYASASATATGYVTGTASSAAVNKTLRQGSLIGAMTAKFIVDYSGQPAIDDGTIATLETNFVAAITTVANGRVIQITDVVGLTGALAGKLSTTGNAASASVLATARTITLGGILGGAANFDGSVNITLTATIADGTLSIAKTSGLQTSLNALAPLDSPAFINTPTAPTLVYSDASTKLANAAFVQAAIAAVVSSGAGYLQIAGWKIQKGSDTCPASGAGQAYRAVTFPVAYTTAPFVMLIAKTNSQAGGPIVSYLLATPTTTGFTAAFDVAEGSGGSPIVSNPVPFDWIAIGS